MMTLLMMFVMKNYFLNLN